MSARSQLYATPGRWWFFLFAMGGALGMLGPSGTVVPQAEGWGAETAADPDGRKQLDPGALHWIIPVSGKDPPLPVKGPEPWLRAARSAVGGRIVRIDGVTTIERPRRFAAPGGLAGSATRASFYEIMQELPEGQIQALGRGFAIVEDRLPTHVQTALRTRFPKEFQKRQRPLFAVRLAPGERERLSPTEVAEAEASILEQTRLANAETQVNWSHTLNLGVFIQIEVYPVGRRPGAKAIILEGGPIGKQAPDAWAVNTEGYLEPISLPPHELYRMFVETVLGPPRPGEPEPPGAEVNP